jgi:hypothetical protein
VPTARRRPPPAPADAAEGDRPPGSPGVARLQSLFSGRVLAVDPHPNESDGGTPGDAADASIGDAAERPGAVAPGDDGDERAG